MKQRKIPTAHRQGNLIYFIDALHELIRLEHNNLWKSDNPEEFPKPNLETAEKMSTILREIRKFDITTTGNLYFTSGGRIVLDQGYGEYFDKSDKILFNREELYRGLPMKEFIERIIERVGEKYVKLFKKDTV